MANKRVSDILARTYFTQKGRQSFSASSFFNPGKNVASRVGSRYYNLNLLLVTINLVLLVLLALVWKYRFAYQKQKASVAVASQEILVTRRGAPIVIAYDFTKKELTGTLEYFFNIGSVDVSGFKALVFDVRFSEGKEHSIRVEFVNNFREVGEVGIPGLDEKWKQVVISLKDVPSISSWNQVQQIGFIIDKWNVSSSKGSVYISNVRFVKEI